MTNEHCVCECGTCECDNCGAECEPGFHVCDTCADRLSAEVGEDDAPDLRGYDDFAVRAS